MRKTVIAVTVIALILSILSTGLLVFFAETGDAPGTLSSTTSAE